MRSPSINSEICVVAMHMNSLCFLLLASLLKADLIKYFAKERSVQVVVR